MPRCFLGLGGNTGDVAATFAAAVWQLGAAEAPVQVNRTSSIYRTAPIGSKAGDAYLNAVAEIETDLAPSDLLQLTQSTEDSFGRKRTVHWGPRTLDIDILLYGDEIIDLPELSIPHPALWYRRFVLDPLAEIAADVKYPNKKSSPYQSPSIWQLRQHLLIRPLPVLLSYPDDKRREGIVDELTRSFPELDFELSFMGSPSAPNDSQMFVWLHLNALNTGPGPLVKVLAKGDRLSNPDSDNDGLEFLTAVITAATDVPEIVAGPISTAPDS